MKYPTWKVKANVREGLWCRLRKYINNIQIVDNDCCWRARRRLMGWRIVPYWCVFRSFCNAWGCNNTIPTFFYIPRFPLKNGVVRFLAAAQNHHRCRRTRPIFYSLLDYTKNNNTCFWRPVGWNIEKSWGVVNVWSVCACVSCCWLIKPVIYCCKCAQKISSLVFLPGLYFWFLYLILSYLLLDIRSVNIWGFECQSQ